MQVSLDDVALYPGSDLFPSEVPAFVATLPDPPAVTGLGARVEVPVTRLVISAWQPAVIDVLSGAATVVLQTPPLAGEYLLVWRAELDPPDLEVFVPLIVVAVAAAWAPSLEDVAQVTPAYTRGGFDDDESQAGAEQGTFTDTTSPTAEHVQGLIVAACDEVQGRVGFPIPPRCFELAQTTARWHAAAAISAGKIPAGTDDASGEYRSHITNFRACLDELIVQARARTILPS